MANIAPLLQYLDIPGMRGAAAAQLTPWAHTPPPMQFSGLSQDLATMQNARADIGTQPPRYQPPLPIINQPINPPPLPWFAYAGGQALPPNDRIPAPPQRPGMAPETSVTAPGGLPQGNFNPQQPPAQVEVDESMGSDSRYGIQPRTDQGFGSYQPSAADFGEKQTQQQSAGMSDAGMWGLLAAGLGILANNYGNYGQAAPAIGKGGMMGLQTFLGERQVQERNKFAQQELDQRQQLQNAQIGNYQSEVDKRKQEILEMQDARKAQADLDAAYQDYMSKLPAGTDMSKLMSDPNTHYGLAGRIQAMNPKAAQLAFKNAQELEKLNQGNWSAQDVTTGGKTKTTKMFNKKDGIWKDVPGALPTESGALVDINAATEKAGSIELAKLDAGQLGEMGKQSWAAAQAQIPIVRMRRAVEDDATYTGALADYQKSVAGIAAAVGIPVDKDRLASSESYEKDMAQWVRNNIKALGSGTAISNIDLAFTVNSGPGMKNTRQGKIIMLKAMEADLDWIQEETVRARQWFRAHDGTMDGYKPTPPTIIDELKSVRDKPARPSIEELRKGAK